MVLNISDVRINLAEATDADKLKAYCSITIDGCFMVRGIKLIDGSKGMFVAMPNRKTQFACKSCRHKNPASNIYCGRCGAKIASNHAEFDPTKLDRVDIAHPLNSECRQQVLDALLSAYSTAVRIDQKSKNEPEHEISPSKKSPRIKSDVL